MSLFRHLALLSLAALTLPLGAASGATPTVDCTESSCPRIEVEGDAPASGAAARASGYADPSLAHVPGRARIWMAYSWPHFLGEGRRTLVGVDTHLAFSDDAGATWSFERALWKSEQVRDPVTGLPTYANTETVALEAARGQGRAADRWFSARTRYVASPLNGLIRPETYEVRIAAASRPSALAEARDVALGIRTPYNDVDVDLARLAPNLRGCSLSNPALELVAGELFLALQCQRYMKDGSRDLEREGIALFSTRPSGRPAAWPWRYRGMLAGRRDAVALGGDTLQAIDLSRAAGGAILAIVTVTRDSQASFDDHLGCAVLEVQSLARARLARSGGAPAPLGWVRASDLAPTGPGTCSYDAASRTGVVIARRVLGGGQLATSLHASGLRP